MTELKEVLDTFEAEQAESLISEMGGAVYKGASIGELLYDVQQDVNNFEFTAASDKVDELLSRVERGEVG